GYRPIGAPAYRHQSCRSFTDRPSGGCGAGAARVADGRYCFPAVEPDASGKSLVKPVRVQRLPDVSYQLGLPLPLQRPRPQADTLARALGRLRQQAARSPSPCTNAGYHYGEDHSGAKPTVSHGRIGVAVFAHDFQTIQPLAERDNTNIVHWSEFDAGGHYAALEVPDVVVSDLRTFFIDSRVRE
ncbi:MAG TPA: hypothetical protein VFM91_04845, partial [Propionibacteriaceae bacterium]|nr:hypothetical protein [Propionibacteriaceae bacterium]